MKVCAESGCPELTPNTRCVTHERARDRARGTRQERGYDRAYDVRHATDTQALRNGAILYCWRCGDPVTLGDYSLGHCDDDRRVTHGPEHLRGCNLANTRGGCPHRTHA